MESNGLYDSLYEHDSCGVGFIANINGQKTHQIVADGLTILKNLTHRGAVGADAVTGDGAGILTQIPWKFIKKVFKAGETDAFSFRKNAVGVFFMPTDKGRQKKALRMTEEILQAGQVRLLGWRQPPINPGCLGKMANQSRPAIFQALLEVDVSGNARQKKEDSGEPVKRQLYILRRLLEKAAVAHGFDREEYYVVSLCNKTIIYKGMFTAEQIEAFYPDLSDADFTSCLALVHQRYSTNTFPSWPLAQPFRYIAHNGEINTLRGNIGFAQARESTMASPLFGQSLSDLFPIIEPNLSDSGVLDQMFELLVQGGRSPEHAIMMMMPEPFGPKYHISRDKRAFYEYHATIMEPWDGPAALVFTDGSKIGATLDRNGLRPARYQITRGNQIILASEIGVLEIADQEVLSNGRLGPGQIILVDTETGRLSHNNEVKARVCRQKPYRRWLEDNRIEIRGLFQPPKPQPVNADYLRDLHRVFGYSHEELVKILKPMALNSQEPISSMGNDEELAVLSEKPQLLCNYFKQLFAQVTNPPIDPYRENLVMSLMSFIGRDDNILAETPNHCRKLKLPHPVLSNQDVSMLRELDQPGHKTSTLDIVYGQSGLADNMEEALKKAAQRAEELVDSGVTYLFISDRRVSATAKPIPALLALAALHQRLIEVGKRHLTALLVESGEVRDVTHVALLIGYGASAVNPYLAIETLTHLIESGRIPGLEIREKGIENYITALKKGLLKIMSKMGVSTIRSYRGARAFEAVGLDTGFVKRYFTGTPSRISGIGLASIQADVETRHKSAFGDNSHYLFHQQLAAGGHIHYRHRAAEHRLKPEAIVALRQAARHNDYAAFQKFTQIIDTPESGSVVLRDLFEFNSPLKPVPLNEVEPAKEIVKRFVSSAMSLGSISPEAHQTIALAMNSLGAMSNAGEGGEPEERFAPLADGQNANSFVKQVASGRFGVSINYLQKAGELQIKMAQGAKPGEGGQLPGHKVNDFVAQVRHSTPGVMLISPPPHHDIYSIEDLAQLIYDLKQANPRARVSVKLVSEAGVGTIAAGVAKAKADMVLISGHDGGTGASPVSSIKGAGVPWEIGLAETQQTLTRNGLRGQIRVQTDGQLRSGRDVVIATLLGAEEFGFGTISLVALGCVMMRKCHHNTCPVGVATQDERLRRRFTGRPEHLKNYMLFVAAQTREIMAGLGFRTIDDMVGRSDILTVKQKNKNAKTGSLDFSALLNSLDKNSRGPFARQSGFEDELDNRLLAEAETCIKQKKNGQLEFVIRNKNRSIGSRLSGKIAHQFGSRGLTDCALCCRFSGYAGQSFGAFLAPGLTFELLGAANDYVGKGLSGGCLIIRPPLKSRFRPQNNTIVGNVTLFGATSGRLFINGMAGERFAVRNSGAVAVVEGLGDHGCEYMTGGLVVVLGRTGINFAAGMSGGIAYVLDEDQLFDTKCNLDMVDVEPLCRSEDIACLKGLIEEHIRRTDSAYARRILNDWTEMAPLFVKVMPIEYRLALARVREQQSKNTENDRVTEEVFN